MWCLQNFMWFLWCIWLYWRMNNIWCVLLHENLFFYYVLRAHTYISIHLAIHKTRMDRHTHTHTRASHREEKWSTWKLELIAYVVVCSVVRMIQCVYFKRFVNTYTIKSSTNEHSGICIRTRCDMTRNTVFDRTISSYYVACVFVCTTSIHVRKRFEYTCKNTHIHNTVTQASTCLHDMLLLGFEQFLGASTEWVSLPKNTHTRAHHSDKEIFIIIKV